MKEYCKKEKAPFPEIKFTDIHFYVLFKPNTEYSKMINSKKTMEGLGEKLGENQIKIIELISNNKFVSIPELSTKIKISTTAIENNLAKLKQKRILRRVGSAKGGYWEIIK